MSSTLDRPLVDIRSAVNLRFRRGAVVNWTRLALLLSSDFAAFSAAWLASAAFFPLKAADNILAPQGSVVWLIVLFMVSMMAARGLYRGGNYWRSLWELVRAVTLAFLFLYVGWFVVTEQTLPFGRSVLVGAWLMSIVFAGMGRSVIKQAIVSLRQRDRFCVPTFVIGPPERREQMARILSAAGYRVVGYTSPTQDDIPNLLEQVMACNAQEVVVATLGYLPGLPAFYRGLRAAGITMRWVPNEGELLLRQVGTTRILCGIPTVEVCPPLIGGMDFRLKRLMDVLLSGAGLLVLSPLLIVIAALVRLSSPGSAFFVQERVGVRGQIFRIYKFRSMYVDAEKRKAELMAKNEVQGPLFKLRNDPRITSIGKLLRRTSLDELPQLWNVLIGEMSLIGPRPPVPSEVALYEKWHYDRLLVLPGITGLAQISGRSDLKHFEDVVRLDLYYIQNWSLALDFDILIKTVAVVLRAKGAY